LLALVQSVDAQEMPGLLNSNYAGVSSVLINPANMVLSKSYFDMHLLTLQSFTQNNLIYIPGEDYRITNFIDPENDLPKYPPDNNNFLYYRNSLDKFAFNQQRFTGPSAMMMYGDHAVALHTAVRTHVSATNVPYEIGVFSIEGLKYDPLHNINFWSKNERISAMAWGEIGLSYAWAFKKEFRDKWSAGITVKRLLGHSAGFMKVDEIDYMVLNDSTIHIRSLTADAGFSVPVDYDSNEFPDDGPLFKGGGFGVDMGLTFTRMKQGFQRYNPDQLCEFPYSDYEFRLGISILDFGAAKFGTHSKLHRFEDVGLLWTNYDSVNYSNLNQMAAEFSQLFTGDPAASLQAESFTLGLPTAISVQFDYHYRRNVYLNATWVQAVPVWKYSLIRPSQIAFTPRYETDWFEFSLPLSLFQYRIPRIGASVRFGYLTVGTERLGTWLGMADLTGIDIYASFKFNLRKGKCLKKRTTDYCENEEYGFTKKQLRLFKKRVR